MNLSLFSSCSLCLCVVKSFFRFQVRFYFRLRRFFVSAAAAAAMPKSTIVAGSGMGVLGVSGGGIFGRNGGILVFAGLVGRGVQIVKVHGEIINETVSVKDCLAEYAACNLELVNDFKNPSGDVWIGVVVIVGCRGVGGVFLVGIRGVGGVVAAADKVVEVVVE